ncbi:MAG: hypothetical protein V4614_13070 [Pseudomonadota bacterium]
MNIGESHPDSLKAAFAARNVWHANRSSAIFAVRLREGCDLLVAYLNYWALKNRIDSVRRIVRLYDEAGQLYGRHDEQVSGNGADFSVRNLFALAADFDGMVEVEFISTDNLRFSFPAIQGFYRAGDAFSTVHSAGRVVNTDEPQAAPRPSRESNWICKFAEGITPFFHVFRSGLATAPVTIDVEVLSPDSEVLFSAQLAGLLKGPFSSKLLLLDDIFPELASHRPEAGSYCRVTVPREGIFPRLVVGNLHRANNLLEVTHSFAQQDGQDFVAKPDGVDLASFIPGIKPEQLDLALYSFPTNAASPVSASLRRQGTADARMQPTGETMQWLAGGPGSRLFRYELAENDRLMSLDLTGAQVPSRLNVSYQFSVPGSPYSTDIATGAKSCAYPPKHSHWGTGVVGAGFRTLLMARNMSHTPAATKRSQGTVKLWLQDQDMQQRELEIEAEAGAFWTIDISAWTVDGSKPYFVHWLANFDQPSIEIFWVSYADDGRICGDHSF